MALPVEYILLDLRAALGRDAPVVLVAPPDKAWVAAGRIVLLCVRKGRVNEAGQGHSVKLREQTPERQLLLEAVVQMPRVKWPQCPRIGPSDRQEPALLERQVSGQAGTHWSN